jgi:hypothetical protein
MTESEVDPLMWSHYTSHKGFVVKYAIDKIPENFLGPFPINYIDDYETFNQKETFLRFLIASNIKYKKHWESEKEWRFLLSSPTGMKLPKFLQNKLLKKDQSKFPRFFSYSNYFSIKEVILGYKLFLNEKVKLKCNQGIGFEVTSNDCQLVKFLCLLNRKKFNTFMLDLHPLNYSEFITKKVSVNQIRRNKFALNFIEP